MTTTNRYRTIVMQGSSTRNERPGIASQLSRINALVRDRLPHAHYFIWWAVILECGAIFGTAGMIVRSFRGDEVSIFAVVLSLIRGSIIPAFWVCTGLALEAAYQRLDRIWGAALIGALLGTWLVGSYVIMLIQFPGLVPQPASWSVMWPYLVGIILFLSALLKALDWMGVNIDPFRHVTEEEDQ